MKTLIKILLITMSCYTQAQNPTGKEILEKIDKNMASKSTISTSKRLFMGKGKLAL
ncbi:MAG: hypothetical protein PF487_02900 [Bacteroidales bacterium]|jgi:hypothetical protein|nr:hypothetical protein [Bacteroidales bacterium]